MSNNKVGIYYDSDTSFYHLNQALDLHDISCTKDIHEFNNYSTKIKLAILHIPFPWDSKFEELVRTIQCDHIFIIGTELHHPIIEFVERNDQDHITYYLCGFIHNKLSHSKIHQFMDWFETSTYFYKHWLPEILIRLKPYEKKNKAFDILLGRKKPHRDFIFDKFITDPQIGIASYFKSHESAIGNDADKWIWEIHGLRMDRTPVWTVDPVQYYGHPMSISQVIPITVYNQTAYSVIAETSQDNHYTFFTEKTVKPIIAKRLFVMFGGMHYLESLKKLGFRTFDNVIDESYDNESNAIVRWQKAWEQMKWLNLQPQEEILDKIKPIVEHNFEVIMSTDWYKQFSRQLEQDFVRIVGH